MEEELEIELEKEGENFEKTGWFKYLALATALIAVIAAVASLESGTDSNEAVLQKNNAVLSQNKASDQWNYYQAKGIKKNVADGFYQQFGNQAFKVQSDKYAAEQADIQKQAEVFQQQVEDADKSSDHFLEKHHKMAFSVTFF